MNLQSKWYDYRSPPRIPEVHLPEEPFLQVASALRIEINRALGMLRDIAAGRDLKKFLGVCSLTLFLIFFNFCRAWIGNWWLPFSQSLFLSGLNWFHRWGSMNWYIMSLKLLLIMRSWHFGLSWIDVVFNQQTCHWHKSLCGYLDYS